jgi:hypothetical protein
MQSDARGNRTRPIAPIDHEAGVTDRIDRPPIEVATGAEGALPNRRRHRLQPTAPSGASDMFEEEQLAIRS